ncbi:portabella-like protein [Sarcoptes scabiei]|uniref:Portabella-like protein n=1 Tax=Sarcoptes scabiei TaxID=52283 RepID=A0A132A2U9_SARSC|nr:portabella-like protein [Sarcoptes scabiei]
MILIELFHRLTNLVEKAQSSRRFQVILVFLAIILDNLLLTVVGNDSLGFFSIRFSFDSILMPSIVPVIPDFLLELENQNLRDVEENFRNSSDSKSKFGHSFDDDHHYLHHLAINGRSMAFLKHIHPNFDVENGQVGTILSSKAFMQLLFNPLVSPIINRFGYELTLIYGSTVLLFSCLIYLIGQSFAMLLIPRAMQGIASALINIAGIAMIANMFREEKSRTENIGFCLGGMATGVLIGYPFGSVFYQWFGKTILFSFVGCLISLIIVIIGVSTMTMSLLESFLPIWLIQEIRPPKWKLGSLRSQSNFRRKFNQTICTFFLSHQSKGLVFLPDSIGYLIGTNFFILFMISLESSL